MVRKKYPMIVLDANECITQHTQARNHVIPVQFNGLEVVISVLVVESYY